MDKITFLKNLDIFRDVSINTLKLISSAIEEKKYKNQEIIFNEGSSGEEFYIIFEGQVEIIKNHQKPNQKLLRILNPKEIFGETSLYPKILRSATAVSKEESIIFEIKSKVFLDIFDKFPKDGLKIIQCLLLNNIIRMEQTSKELSSIYSISYIMSEAFKKILDVENFLKNVAYEIISVLPQNYSFEIYLYNKFNDEYQVVFSHQISDNTLIKEKIFNKESVLFNFNKVELQQKLIEDKNFYVCTLTDTKNIFGAIVVYTSSKDQVLQQQYKDLLVSVANLVSVSISGLLFLQEEREKIKLQNIKTKYIF